MPENDLISRSALIEQLNLAAPEYFNAYIAQIVANAPAVDAVEVVRCRVCKKNPGYTRNKNELWCRQWRGYVRQNDFCGHGERRNGDATD